MLPEEVFKRRQRHNNTPEHILLIIVNFIVVALDIVVFSDKNHINWFFWIVIAALALYNFFTIRHNREEFTRVVVISYVFNLIILVVVFFLLRGRA